MVKKSTFITLLLYQPPQVPPLCPMMKFKLAAHNGTVIDARNNRTYPGLANEAIERCAVTLDTVGECVEFTVPRSTNSIVVRYAIPGEADGKGLTALIGLFPIGEPVRAHNALFIELAVKNVTSGKPNTGSLITQDQTASENHYQN